MLHFVQPPVVNSKQANKRVVYWKITVSFPEIKSLEFKVATLSEFALLTSINYITLRKIVYDKNYHSKKYDTAFKHISITPVYV